MERCWIQQAVHRGDKSQKAKLRARESCWE
jgi:hypothetical protein